jgi:Flp pilus assembly protein TadG
VNGLIRSFRHQHGQVAIIVGIALLLLIMMVGLVVDLGFLYTRKTELQNAADAAALAGAKQLNGTADGIQAAADAAIAMAGLNNVDFGGNAIAIEESEIEFGPNPDGPWSNVTDAKNDPAGKFFVKVDTRGIGQSSVATWFMRVVGIGSTTTSGRAVAGPYVVDIAPLGVCAVDKTRPERGFIRGVSYNIPQLNPLILPADPLWINPVNAPPDSCDDVNPHWNSASYMAPFVCSGKSIPLSQKLGTQVFVNTGSSAALGKALNSRFDDYQGSPCDVATAPPDTNVKEYHCTKVGTGPNPDNCVANPPAGAPRDWMDTVSGSDIPTQQGITIINRVPIAKSVNGATRTNTASKSDYGVLWSYAWEKNFATGANHTLNDWPSLYGMEADQTANGYPSTIPPEETHASPYKQTSGSKYFAPPPSHPPGEPNRRIINVVIVDCSDPALLEQVGAGNKCAALPTLGVAKFLMPVKADLPKSLFLEFVEAFQPPSLEPDIRLYR